MSVDEAMAYASKDKCFWTGEVHTALETLAAEVERLRATVENKDAAIEMLANTIDKLQADLTAAKAEREAIQKEALQQLTDEAQELDMGY